MQGKRLDRVNHLIQMELSQIVLHKMKDPRLGYVTILKVDVSPDLRSARVFYSVLGGKEEKTETQEALEKGAGFLQREIARALILRFTPKLRFILDESVDKRLEIDRVIKQIHDQDQ